ncbi:AbrB/MazE/SpoVT family DNA-binding domain-containing protein [Pseudomonas sp. HN2-3]|uniref:AbrB/MazE/SpoVT family DNA-binding domain-containing protein n=1 Tax=Pseudomonas sp. HN2-3 TaxID=2886360 RepID=UPI001D12DAA8|nr:AbrB/MazE/SpoVT family DNA-binding domain-containing protein [Pseudomonas sp. HN2-3]UDU83153.1 AbrB/MazE/SpoVT family DNA-binding domain-containing protein [Pseudomonas sp. HN2-3]
MNTSVKITIEDWNGDGAVRIPDEALQEMGVDVGDSLYLVEEFIGNRQCLILTKAPKLPDPIDELVEQLTHSTQSSSLEASETAC